MPGYGAREVAEMLGVSLGQVRSYVRAGFLTPERDPRGALHFSFQDLLLLRTAQGLVSAQVPARRVTRALRSLRERLPADRPLTGVQLGTDGGQVVVGDGGRRWLPESGQVLLDFAAPATSDRISPLARERAGGPTADDFYHRACDAEESSPDEARDAYRRALELDPDHIDARVNLGRLLHEAGDRDAAVAEYRRVLEAHPDHAIAAFNLGVTLEDLGRASEAISAYALAVAADPSCADAHYNLSRLYERSGQPAPALRHLRTYRQLTRG